MAASTLSLSFPHSPTPHPPPPTPICLSISCTPTPVSLVQLSLLSAFRHPLSCRPCLSPTLLSEWSCHEVCTPLCSFLTFRSGPSSCTLGNPGQSHLLWEMVQELPRCWGEKVCSPLRITALTRRGSFCYCREGFALGYLGLSSEAKGAKSGLTGQIKPWARAGTSEL